MKYLVVVAQWSWFLGLERAASALLPRVWHNWNGFCSTPLICLWLCALDFDRLSGFGILPNLFLKRCIFGRSRWRRSCTFQHRWAQFKCSSSSYLGVYSSFSMVVMVYPNSPWTSPLPSAGSASCRFTGYLSAHNWNSCPPKVGLLENPAQVAASLHDCVLLGHKSYLSSTIWSFSWSSGASQLLSS